MAQASAAVKWGSMRESSDSTIDGRSEGGGAIDCWDMMAGAEEWTLFVKRLLGSERRWRCFRQLSGNKGSICESMDLKKAEHKK